MNNFFPVLAACKLFSGIPESDIKKLLDCLSARQKRYQKNSFIVNAGDAMDSLGIVLEGAAHVLQEDYWGKRTILTRVEVGGMFGEALACAGVEKFPVSVLAAEDSAILFVNCKRIMTFCSSACGFHGYLIKNLTMLLAEQTIALVQKLECITQPSTREKLLSYLSEQARLVGNSTFSIPFNRKELAEYLSVERSAMSAELSRMKTDGLVRYQKNHFELLKEA